MGLPMSETIFLRDMHRWAMKGHIQYLTETNETIDKTSQHAASAANNHDANDQAGAQAMRRVIGA